MTEHSEHTPGPWRVDGEGIRAMVRGADTTIVAVRHRLPSEIHAANARLIAAAPDLLAALQAILDPDNESIVYFVPSDSWATKLKEDARAAIAKATGA